jgi:glycosyltransferase 2 family protein
VEGRPLTAGERALVVARGVGATEEVGGLPLAARAVLALRAAGLEEVAVLAGSERRRLEPALASRGVDVRWVSGPGDLWPEPGSESIRIVPGDHLVDASGVGRAPRCIGRALPGLVDDLAAGRPLGEALRRTGVSPEPALAPGLFVPLDPVHPPARLEAMLLDALGRHTEVADSYLAAVVDRRLSRPVTRRLLGRPWVSPSRVTGLSLAVGLLGAAGLATTGYGTRLAAVLCLLVSIVLDCVDGEIARARFEQSAAGARLDVIGDYLVNLAVFVGLGIGLAREGSTGLAVGLVLVGGVLAATSAMHVLFVRPALVRGGDLHWEGDDQSLRGGAAAAVMEKLASRDYTYLLLLLALIGHLEWFVYAAAVGSWLFAGALVLCQLGRGVGGGVRPGQLMARLRGRWVEAGALGVGLAVLGLTLWKIGLDGLLRDLSTIGWGLVLILLVESGNVLLNTRGWAFGFPAGERTVAFWRLVAMRLAGDSVNYLTPSATVGGELVRIRLLGRLDESASLVWASVSVAKVGQTLAQAVFIFLGLGVVLPRLTALPTWLGLAGGAAGAVLVSGGFVWLTGRGFWRTLAGLARRLGFERRLPAGWGPSGRDLDAALGRLGRGRTTAALVCFVAAWAVGAVEVLLILRWAGVPIDWGTALAVETGSVVIDGILFFVPAKVGTQEGGKVLLFSMLGLDPARGLTVGVVRRIRELVYAGLGLAVLAWLTASRRGAPDSRARAEAALGARSG